jgi:hypothetical protein
VSGAGVASRPSAAEQGITSHCDTSAVTLYEVRRAVGLIIAFALSIAGLVVLTRASMGEFPGAEARTRIATSLEEDAVPAILAKGIIQWWNHPLCKSVVYEQGAYASFDETSACIDEDFPSEGVPTALSGVALRDWEEIGRALARSGAEVVEVNVAQWHGMHDSISFQLNKPLTKLFSEWWYVTRWPGYTPERSVYGFYNYPVDHDWYFTKIVASEW